MKTKNKEILTRERNKKKSRRTESEDGEKETAIETRDKREAPGREAGVGGFPLTLLSQDLLCF